MSEKPKRYHTTELNDGEGVITRECESMEEDGIPVYISVPVYKADEIDKYYNALLAEKDKGIARMNEKIELLHAKILGMEKFRENLRRIIGE